MNLRPQKRILLTWAVVAVLCLAAAVIAIAIDGGRGRVPVVPAGRIAAEGNYQVAFSDETVAGDLVIRALPSVADDGSLAYQVLTPQGTPLGTFNYIPWQDQNPLFRELPGGDLILGSHSLYRKSDQKIHPLGEDAGFSSVFDYAVNGSKLALAGEGSQGDDTRISVGIRNLNSDTWTQVDSFQYPDYLDMNQVYLCWAGGRLYYDSCQDNIPVVKEYDPATNQSSTFKENAMNPQASPDGRYLALFASDAPSGKTGPGIGLELVDLDDGRVAGLEGSSRLFWSPGYVTTWDGQLLELHVYDLSSGVTVKDVPIDSPVADLAIDNGILRGTSYHFENKQITKQQFETEVGGQGQKNG